METSNSTVHYYVISQNRNNVLEIGIVGQRQRIMRTAAEVFADRRLLSGFSAKDAAFIGLIAGAESLEAPKLN